MLENHNYPPDIFPCMIYEVNIASLSSSPRFPRKSNKGKLRDSIDQEKIVFDLPGREKGYWWVSLHPPHLTTTQGRG